jgi:hypothetical protein
MLPYEEETRRLWQIVPWPPIFSSDTKPGVTPFSTFLQVIATSTIALDADYGFGGTGLPEAVFASRFAEYDKKLKPLPSGIRLTDVAYSFMVLRKEQISNELFDRLRDEDFLAVEMTTKRRISRVERFGPNEEFVFVGIENPPRSFPDAADLVGVTVGDVIGRPHVLKLILKQW